MYKACRLIAFPPSFNKGWKLMRFLQMGNEASCSTTLHWARSGMQVRYISPDKGKFWWGILGARYIHLQALGMRLPEGLSAELIAEAVGPMERLRTIDVTTQQPGPRYTLSKFSCQSGRLSIGILYHDSHVQCMAATLKDL